tara:strand:+ start:403 stop:723 length:321 start_codon:yes stop_codon:yes gene_type:complete
VDDIREVVSSSSGPSTGGHYFLLYQAAAPSGHCWITVHLYSGILFLRLLLKKSKYKPGKLKSWKLENQKTSAISYLICLLYNTLITYLIIKVFMFMIFNDTLNFFL